MDIDVFSGAKVELIVKGQVTVNSNEDIGIISFLDSNTNLEINVESGATLTTCENRSYDIDGSVLTGATATFLGDGYTCDPNKVDISVFGAGTVVKPNCQPCI